MDISYRKRMRLLYFDTLVNELLKKFKPEVVLDIGCAEGLLIQTWGKYGVRAYGCDISMDFVKASDVKSNIVISNIENLPYLPFKNEVFDMVTVIEVLEHIRDIGKVIEELKRVLKPNGLVFMTTPTPIEQFVREIFGKACKEHVTIKPKRFWVDKFEQSGFYYEDFENIYCRIVEKYLLELSSPEGLELKSAKILARLGGIKVLLPHWKNVALFRKI